MRLGFDAKRAVKNFTGLGNYSRFILEALTSVYPQNAYYLYSPKPPSEGKPFPLKASMTFRHPSRKQPGGFWRSRGIISDLKRDRIDVYHGLSNELPFGIKAAGIKTVVTIHDLIFLRYPHFYPRIDRMIYSFKFRYACEHADKIIAISEQTKADLMHFWNIPEDRIEVVYQDCNEIFRKLATAEEKREVRLKYRLPEQFLLNVGTIENRKNLLLIVQALKELPENLSLVVVGKETAYSQVVNEFVNANHLYHRIRFLKNVSYEDLPVIYQLAEVFVYPSRFEGFGIPIIEALHSKIPVIAATGSCLEEAGGSETIYVHPDDSSGLAEAIKLVLADASKREKMITAGLNHLQKFSRAHIAQRLTDIYQKLLHDA